MSAVRYTPGHINHRSGKMSYVKRVQKWQRRGSRYPHMATLHQIYKDDPNGKEIADELQKKMDEIDEEMEGNEGLPTGVEPLSEAEEAKIIEAILEKYKDSRPTTRSARKPPRPRKTPNTQAYMDLVEELRNTKEMLKESEAKWEGRLKVIEAQLRIEQPADPSLSEGASNAR